MLAAVMHGTLLCLPVTPGGDCSLIKAFAKMKELFDAARKLRSGRKTLHRDEGWKKGSCRGVTQLT